MRFKFDMQDVSIMILECGNNYFRAGAFEHPRPPDISWVGDWNLDQSGVRFCNFFNILPYFKPQYGYALCISSQLKSWFYKMIRCALTMWNVLLLQFTTWPQSFYCWSGQRANLIANLDSLSRKTTMCKYLDQKIEFYFHHISKKYLCMSSQTYIHIYIV